MEGQMGLDIFEEILPEENQKLIKKIAKLKNTSTGDYVNLPLEELKKILEEEETRIKEITKTQKALEELDLIYDGSKSIEENKKILEEAIEISKTKKGLEELGSNYDESKTIAENKKMLEESIELKNNPTFLYPFKIYFKGHDIQQPDHIFEEGQRYTEKQIIERMFKHGYREFSGQVKLEFIADENLLVPNFTSQRHG